jgi:hypothetical protein
MAPPGRRSPAIPARERLAWIQSVDTHAEMESVGSKGRVAAYGAAAAALVAVIDL